MTPKDLRDIAEFMTLRGVKEVFFDPNGFVRFNDSAFYLERNGGGIIVHNVQSGAVVGLHEYVSMAEIR